MHTIPLARTIGASRWLARARILIFRILQVCFCVQKRKYNAKNSVRFCSFQTMYFFVHFPRRKGPGMYHLKDDPGHGVTMKSRHPDGSSDPTPGPNAYNLDHKDKGGITMAGRGRYADIDDTPGTKRSLIYSLRVCVCVCVCLFVCLFFTHPFNSYSCDPSPLTFTQTLYQALHHTS